MFLMPSDAFAVETEGMFEPDGRLLNWDANISAGNNTAQHHVAQTPSGFKPKIPGLWEFV